MLITPADAFTLIFFVAFMLRLMPLTSYLISAITSHDIIDIFFAILLPFHTPFTLIDADDYCRHLRDIFMPLIALLDMRHAADTMPSRRL